MTRGCTVHCARTAVGRERTLVIATEGSAPRPLGAALAVTEDTEVAGSVSGGCIEAAVIEETADVLRIGLPRRVTYGISDENAMAVGLSCGGVVHIFVASLGARHRDFFAALARAVREEDPVVLATAVEGPQAGAMLLVAPGQVSGSLGDPGLEEAVIADALAALDP